jgi:hypothetical protein
MADPILHPVQVRRSGLPEGGKLSSSVTLRAYEVYVALYGEQPALVTGGCRGGFGVGELVAFLYAHSFPRNEWRQRAEDAFRGMVL